MNCVTFIPKTYNMKKIRTIVTILFLSLILTGITSCLVSRHVDNGRHTGWFHRHNVERRHHKGAVLIITPEHRHNRERNYDPD
jgi:hypothetical protein